MAPDGEGHFEAYGLRAIFAQGAWCALLVDLVCGGGAFEVGWDVASLGVTIVRWAFVFSVK